MQLDQMPRCDPAFLGPLTDDPVVATGPVRIFQGEERFLSKRKLNERDIMWRETAPHLENVLDDDETVLYILPALHIPGILHQLGFGIWWSLFYRSVLVLTDRRAIDISMRDWKRAGTRVCSYSWAQVKTLKLSMGTLKIAPASGRTQKWKLPVRGDRKLLKLLIPHIQEHLPNDIHAPQQSPTWHCPKCGAATQTHPTTCAECGTEFKTTGLAAVLSLAFPGAGLFYAGHTGLAILDLLGEAVVFLMVASFFLAARTGADVIGAVIVGLMLLFLTKLESAHLATALVKRTVPDMDPGRWKKVAAAGAIVSLLMIALPPIFAGAFADRLDRDLDLSANTIGWTGSHDPNTWRFGADPDQRSEWLREDGPALFVFSMPIAETTQELETALQQDGEQTEPKRFAGFECIKSVGESTDEDGNPILWARWFLFDREYSDLHVIVASVWPEDLEELEPDIESALLSATWIPVAD